MRRQQIRVRLKARPRFSSVRILTLLWLSSLQLLWMLRAAGLHLSFWLLLAASALSGAALIWQKRRAVCALGALCLILALFSVITAQGDARILLGSVLLQLGVYALCWLRRCWPLVLLQGASLLALPFFGADPGVMACFCFFALLALFPLSRKNKLILSCGCFILALLLSTWQQLLYQAVYEAEGLLQRTTKRIIGMADDPGDGQISRGNLYPANMTQLQLESDFRPKQTLYLRSFVGSDYAEGEWQEDRNTILAAAESDLHWEDWPGWVSGLYDTMYFAMNISTQDIVPHTLQITQRGDVWRQRLTPYFSYYDQLSIRQEEDGRYTYSFRLYTQEEMAIDWDEVSSDFVTNRDWYRALQGAYMQELDQYYLQVPREQLPRLAALCAAHPAADAQEATAFIRSMLQGNAVYTQTPGIFPLNEDPSEYFLFEGHAGYCQHFASTAVLMYRLLGIPARYATGYAVSPDAFVRQEDGAWQADVSDVSAHAWAEIFVEDLGWIPVEVTPSSAAAQPVAGGDAQRIELGWADAAEERDAQEEQAARESGSVTLTVNAYAISAGIMLCLAALGGWRLYTYIYLDVQGLMHHFLRYARMCTGKQSDVSEETLILDLPRVVEGFTPKQAQRLLALSGEAAFGAGEQPGEREEVRKLLRHFLCAASAKLPLLVRIWTRIIYGKERSDE